MAQKFNLDGLLISAQNRTDKRLTEDDLLSNIYFQNRILDQVDGRVIIRSQCSVATDEGILAFSRISGRELIDYQITQGEAIIQTDPFNGEVLITPKGDVPVRVRPVLESILRDQPVRIVGGEQEIGIDIRNIPFDERTFARGGGGACASVINLGERFEFELRVRAFMPANVIPLSLTRRRINWHHALYFAHDPKIGFMRIRYNPDFQSQTNLQTQSDERNVRQTGFFPADGRNDLYFVIEMRDLGLSCFNKKPMTQAYQNTEWPPYSTVLTIEEPVEFFSTENPDQLMMTIYKNDMQIYDYSSIEVECVHYEISEDGLLKSRWRFRNQSSERVMSRWFALGNFKPSGLSATEGSRILGPAKSGFDEFQVEFTGQVEKSSLSQFITMNIVSLNDPVVMGSQRLDFRFPEIEA